eukprot:scaffold6456_cov98-Isochrysis_galbana.AAC.3
MLVVCRAAERRCCSAARAGNRELQAINQRLHICTGICWSAGRDSTASGPAHISTEIGLGLGGRRDWRKGEVVMYGLGPWGIFKGYLARYQSNSRQNARDRSPIFQNLRRTSFPFPIAQCLPLPHPFSVQFRGPKLGRITGSAKYRSG